MARKRTKEVTEETPQENVEHVSEAAPPTGGDMTGEQGQAKEPDAPPPEPQTGAEPQERKPHPTHWFMAINLGDTNASPKMHLGRSNGFQQMQLRFDEKPDAETIQKLRDAGWKYRGQEKVWSLQLDPEARATTQLNAERLFSEIGNAIRAGKGLAPVGQGQGAGM